MCQHLDDDAHILPSFWQPICSALTRDTVICLSENISEAYNHDNIIALFVRPYVESMFKTHGFQMITWPKVKVSLAVWRICHILIVLQSIMNSLYEQQIIRWNTYRIKSCFLDSNQYYLSLFPVNHIWPTFKMLLILISSWYKYEGYQYQKKMNGN